MITRQLKTNNISCRIGYPMTHKRQLLLTYILSTIQEMFKSNNNPDKISMLSAHNNIQESKSDVTYFFVSKWRYQLHSQKVFFNVWGLPT